MKRIGLLSDTHGYLHPSIFKHFKECDQIWHAGDIGTLDVLDTLEAFKPTIAVYGNIDGQNIRVRTQKNAIFKCEGMKIVITHIGGYPPKYKPTIHELLNREQPDVFICGHSHILKVMPDKPRNLIHMNPGAAGKHGFQQVSTLLRFTIDKARITDMQAIELKTVS